MVASESNMSHHLSVRTQLLLKFVLEVPKWTGNLSVKIFVILMFNITVCQFQTVKLMHL